VLQHVSDYRGSIIRGLVQCLAKNYKNDSIVSFDMDKVGVMAVCTHAHNGSEYIATTPTLSMSTDTIESFL